MANDSASANTTAQDGAASGERLGGFPAVLLGLYLVATMVAQIALVIAFWPVADAASPNAGAWLPPGCPDFMQSACALSKDGQVIVLVLVAGGVGAMVHALRSFAAHAGAKRLGKSWIWWYILRPIEGAIIALAFYFLMRAGLLAINAGGNSVKPDITIDGVNVVCGIAVLVGMFSQQAVAKLKDLAETLFAKADTGVTVQPRPKPTVSAIEPAVLRQGAEDRRITVTGKDFARDSEGRADGAPRETVYRSASELVVTLGKDDVAAGGKSVEVTVHTPPPGGGDSDPVNLTIQ